MSINQWDFTLKEFPSAVAYLHLSPIIEIKNTTCALAPIDQNTFIGCMTTFQDLSFAGIKADMVKMCNDNCVRVINLWHNCMVSPNVSYAHPDLLSQYYRSACVTHPSQGYNCLTSRLEYMESKGNSIQDYLNNNEGGVYQCDSCTRESMRAALQSTDYLSTFQLQDYGVDTLNKAQSRITGQCGKAWDQLVDPKPLEMWQIAFIIAGSIVGLLLVILAVYCCVKRRKRNKLLRPPNEPARDSATTLLPPPSNISHGKSSKTVSSTKADHYSAIQKNYDPFEEYKVSTFQ
eukprot:NODE_7_length_67686_cov_1.621421.p20 type:complete len:290 gc:universal NODE_7_length_67686_cov_1.621421:46698-47567(+)